MKRTILVLLAGALLLALAGPIQARSNRHSLEGEATVVSKDMEAGTLRLNKTDFVVTDETLMRDQKGNLITLAQVPVPRVDKEEDGDWIVIGARFRAMRIGGNNVLISLRLIDAPN